MENTLIANLKKSVTNYRKLFIGLSDKYPLASLCVILTACTKLKRLNACLTFFRFCATTCGLHSLGRINVRKDNSKILYIRTSSDSLLRIKNTNIKTFYRN